MKNIKDMEMDEIVDLLNYWTSQYDQGKSLVSDQEWDELYFELVKKERYAGHVLPDSPTQKISYQVVNELTKAKHNHPMLSLAKTKDWNEFLRYFDYHSVVGMCKLDGLTCTLEYIDGRLIAAETRGDGEVGEVITHNILTLPSVPKKINHKGRLVVDGEILSTYQDFEKFSNEYSNPRNFAAGSIRLLDSKECAARNLKFVVWNIVEGIESNSFIDRLVAMDKLGFLTVPWTSSFDWDAKDFLIERAQEEGYPIDGLVGRFNDIEYGRSLGSTDHHSKAAYAYKFADDLYPTTLLDIEWTMGRTGALTPVAIFEPVEIEGAIIERANLHNLNVIKQTLGTPYTNQPIRIYRANMIIPQVYDAEPDEGLAEQVPIIPPMHCPICGHPTEVRESETTSILMCGNPHCEGKLINHLDHFCGKKGLDIKGLSTATLEKVIDWGWVGNAREIFSLSNFRDEWIGKPGFGPKSVDRVLDAIEEARKGVELDAYISALGIQFVGPATAKVLAEYFGSWEAFMEADDNCFDYTQIPSIGPETAGALTGFDFSEAYYIAKNLVKVNDIPKEEKQNSLQGLNFVVTGTLKNFKNRSELQKVIEKNGGKVTSSISSKTNYLVNNDINSTSAKNVSAKKLGIPILTEEELLSMFDF